MKRIKLSNTTAKCLIQALTELEETESDCGCNDLFSRDKYFLLSEKERARAAELTGGYGFNSSATEFLLDTIKKQVDRKRKA